MGFVAENALIQSSLIQSLKQNTKIDCMFPVTLQSIAFPFTTQADQLEDNKPAIVQLENGDRLRTQLVISC